MFNTGTPLFSIILCLLVHNVEDEFISLFVGVTFYNCLDEALLQDLTLHYLSMGTTKR